MPQQWQCCQEVLPAPPHQGHDCGPEGPRPAAFDRLSRELPRALSAWATRTSAGAVSRTPVGP